MRPMRAIVLAACALVLAACATPGAPACDVEAGPRAYEARGIGQQWIDYVWVELGTAQEAAGTVPGRLFVASADPVGAIVPTMIDLPCGPGAVEYAPEPVEFEVAEGRFKTSYSWGSCARCSECYMRWTFRLDLEAQLEGEVLAADLVLNETFHDQPMEIVSVRMQDTTAACTEPRLRCKAAGECGALRFAERE